MSPALLNRFVHSSLYSSFLLLVEILNLNTDSWFDDFLQWLMLFFDQPSSQNH